jgi:ubiquinone/menaquinone biosynthesis C-methylase UbiE
MTMTEQAREVQEGGTWGPRDAAAEWRRGAAARLQAFGPATEMMLGLVKVAEGSRVLDVGAGAGDSTLVAAQRVGSKGRVLATDMSASMLEIAAESARQAGLNNVDTRVVDAQRLDLDPDSFDAVVSRNCLMLIPDYQQALTSIRRVLKPGGRFGAIVFSTPDRCPYLSLPHAIVFRIGRLTSPAPERFGEFRLAAPSPARADG